MADYTPKAGGLLPRNVVAGRDFNPLVLGDDSHPESFPPGTVLTSAGPDLVVPGVAGASEQLASVAGLASAPGIVGQRVIVQTHGVLTLTEAQWSAAIDGGGALLPGRVYFLSASLPSGQLTAITPSSTGDWIAQVGIALSPTDFLIRICLATQVS